MLLGLRYLPFKNRRRKKQVFFSWNKMNHAFQRLKNHNVVSLERVLAPRCAKRAWVIFVHSSIHTGHGKKTFLS
jgi:hypothetical protein